MRTGLLLILLSVVGCGQNASEHLKIARPQANSRQQMAVSKEPLVGSLFIMGTSGRYCLNMAAVTDSLKKKGDDLVRLNLKNFKILNASNEPIIDKHSNQLFFKQRGQLILDQAKASTIDQPENANFRNFLSFHQIDCSKATLDLGEQIREFDIDQAPLQTAAVVGNRNQQSGFKLPQTTQGSIRLFDRKNREEWTFTLKNSFLELQVTESPSTIEDRLAHCPPTVTAKIQKTYRFDWGRAQSQDLKIGASLTQRLIDLGGTETVWSQAYVQKTKKTGTLSQAASDNQISETLYKTYTENLEKFEVPSCEPEAATK